MVGRQKVSRGRRQENTADRQRITIFLPDGALNGLASRLTPTGLTAHLDGAIPEDGRFPFTLHLKTAVIGGEIRDVGADGDLRRLQFVALSPAELRLLAPYVSSAD